MLREPWATLLAAEFIQEMTMNTTNPGRDLDGRGSNTMSLMPPAGHVTDPQPTAVPVVADRTAVFRW